MHMHTLLQIDFYQCWTLARHLPEQMELLVIAPHFPEPKQTVVLVRPLQFVEVAMVEVIEQELQE